VLGIEHRAFRDTELVAVDEEAAAGIIQKFECEAVAGIGIAPSTPTRRPDWAFSSIET
jgi:hypothetical protein